MREELARSERYTRVAVWLHWVIAALIGFNLWLGLGHDSLPKEWKVMPVHKAVGVTVLALTLVRIGWRLAHPAPPLPATISSWQRVAAHGSHFLLYFLMLALPLTGWAMASGPQPRPLTWFGLFDIPYLPVSPGAAEFGHDAHELLGWAMLALALLHVAAALFHHVVSRDVVLARMAPVVRPPDSRAIESTD